MHSDDIPVIESKDFRIIQETDLYVLGYIWEYAYLVDKVNGSETFLCEFYGVCDSGVLSPNNDWCVVGGDLIAIWKNSEVNIIDRDELKWVNDLRQIAPFKVEILIDPWSKDSAIWELNIEDLSFIRIRDFNDYKDKPYVENVVW
jgi:hypothetical protein